MDKKIILHVDDLWSSIAANDAGFALLDRWIVTSGAVMVPCRGFEDAINRYRKNLQLDLWIHLTLTSERGPPFAQWGPTLSQSDVPSLVDQQGYFHKTVDDFLEKATYADVKKEVCNQIKIALQTRLPFSHYDSHMGVLLHRKFFPVYKEITTLFNLSPFICNPVPEDTLGNWFFDCQPEIEELCQKGYRVVDHYEGSSPYSGADFSLFFSNRLKNIQDWTTYFLLHVLSDNLSIQDKTPDVTARINEYNWVKWECFTKSMQDNHIRGISMKDFLS